MEPKTHEKEEGSFADNCISILSGVAEAVVAGLGVRNVHNQETIQQEQERTHVCNN